MSEKRSSLILGASLVMPKEYGWEKSPNKAGSDKLDDKILSLDVFEWNELRDGSCWNRNSFCLMTESEMAFSRVGISRPTLLT